MKKKYIKPVIEEESFTIMDTLLTASPVKDPTETDVDDSDKANIHSDYKFDNDDAPLW